MINLKINKQKFTIPTSWEEVTVKQYLALKEIGEDDDLTKVLSALTGISAQVLAKCSHESLLNVLMYRNNKSKKWFSYLDWANSDPDFKKLPIPEWVHIGKMMYKIPGDLSECSFGQHVTIKQLIESEEKGSDITHQVPFIAAVFMQPIVHNADYDEDRAMDLAQDILESSWIQILPIATFFLEKATSYGDPLPKLVRVLTPRKWKRTLVNLMTSV